MKKKSVLLVLTVIAILSCISAGARASEYLFTYGAYAYAGDTGEVSIDFNVIGNQTSDRIGVSKITLYRDNGRMVEAITGSVNNGLIIKSDSSHFGSHTFDHLTPGESYYAEVTVFAEYNGGSDSRVIETNSVRAPY